MIMNNRSSMSVSGKTMYFSSLRTISFLFAMFAVTVLHANSQTTTIENKATTAPTSNSTEPVPFRCLGICGNDEGELDEPDKVVSYQWNSRVPTCAGLSCETGSCSGLEEKLGLLQTNEFECARHRRELQDTAGCTCSAPKPRPEIFNEVIPQGNDDGDASQSSHSGGYYNNWCTLAIASVASWLL